MLLSIGMIVKNEERTLRDCLNAIKPILEQVDSQLIIADTGSTDNTIAIAKEFAHIFYEIPWTNDFSAARNTTLAKATGEWYMYLDADEIFQDVSAIIEFFNSGEYKSYECARHKRYEYLSRFTHEPVRLFKKHPDTFFIDKIHEVIPPRRPKKRLEATSIHMDAREVSPWYEKMKHERNTSLLLDMYKENPSNVRAIVHLVAGYLCYKSYAEAREFIDIGLRLFDKSSCDIRYHYLAATNVLYYYDMKLYEDTVEAARDYLKTAKRSFTFLIFVNLVEGEALSGLKRFDEAYSAYTEALNQYEKLERGELDDEDVMEGLSLIKIPASKNYIVAAIATHYLRTGDFQQAFDMVKKYNVSINNAASAYITECYENSLWDKIDMFYGYLTKTFGAASDKYTDIVVVMEKSIPNVEIKNKLSNTLASRYDDNTDYIRLQRLRKYGLDCGELDYFINADKGFSDMYGDVIVAAIRKGIDFSKFVESLNINDMEWFAKHAVASNSSIPFESLLNEDSWYHTCCSLKTLKLIYMMCEASLNVDLFEAYTLICNNYLLKVYKDTVYCHKEIHALPKRHGFIYYAAKGVACKKGGDIRGFISNLKEALKIDNSMKDIIAIIAERLQEAPLSPQEELNREMELLKSTIISLIQNGQTEQAQRLLDGYEQLMPSDPDINKIKGLLNI